MWGVRGDGGLSSGFPPLRCPRAVSTRLQRGRLARGVIPSPPTSTLQARRPSATSRATGAPCARAPPHRSWTPPPGKLQRPRSRARHDDQHRDVNLAPEEAQRRRSGALATPVHAAAEAARACLVLPWPEEHDALVPVSRGNLIALLS